MPLPARKSWFWTPNAKNVSRLPLLIRHLGSRSWTLVHKYLILNNHLYCVIGSTLIFGRGLIAFNWTVHITCLSVFKLLAMYCKNQEKAGNVNGCIASIIPFSLPVAQSTLADGFVGSVCSAMMLSWASSKGRLFRDCVACSIFFICMASCRARVRSKSF